MNQKLKAALIIALVAILIVGVVYAVSTWSQTINWTIADRTVIVTSSVPDNPINFGFIDVNTQKTITYTVANNGNVPVTITLSATGGGFTQSWNPDPPTATLNPDVSTVFTLTLTITGSGSCIVSVDVT